MDKDKQHAINLHIIHRENTLIDELIETIIKFYIVNPVSGSPDKKKNEASSWVQRISVCLRTYGIFDGELQQCHGNIYLKYVML